MAPFDQITASRAVLIEVANVLGELRQHFVLVGGWVPELLFPNRGHIGSLDVDLAIAPSASRKNAYQTILRRMIDAGFTYQTEPNCFIRNVEGVPAPVKVDLICGQYHTAEKTESIQINELQIKSLRGVDLAFRACEVVRVTGLMPNRTQNTVQIRVASPEVFLLTKAFALDERVKDKDAYDIAFVLSHYEPSLSALAERLRPQIGAGLGREAYAILKAKFASPDSVGPAWAAKVVPGAGQDVERFRRAAFEDAQALFRLVDR